MISTPVTGLQANHQKYFQGLIVLVLLTAIATRLWQLGLGRSLWHDEALLALNIVQRSWFELFNPLDGNQVAPPLFLLMAKFMTTIFGESDISLRLIPCFAGCLSVYFIWESSRRLFSGPSALFATVLIGFCGTTIYYSGELKQYSTDLLASSILMMAAPILNLEKRSHFAMILLLCMVLPWLSHPALFVIPGFFLFIFGPAFYQDFRKPVTRFGFAVMMFITSVLVHFIWILRHTSQNQYLNKFWAENFLPLNRALPGWLIDKLNEFHTGVLGVPIFFTLITLTSLAVLIFGGKVRLLLLTLTPVVLMLMACACKIYPVTGRFLLFLLPSYALILAGALETVLSSHRRNKFKFVLGSVAGSALILFVLFGAWVISSNPIAHEDIKPLMIRLSHEAMPDDFVYVYYGALPAFDYYCRQYRLPTSKIIRGISARDRESLYAAEIRSLPEGRIWYLFSHIKSTPTMDEGRLFLDAIEKRGSFIDDQASHNTVLLLYKNKPL